MLRIALLATVVLLVSLSVAPSDAADNSESLRLVRVASGLRNPVFAVPAPSRLPGRLYVVEQSGVIRIVDRGHVLSQPFLDLHRQVQAGGLRGMFSLAFHPDYLRNGRFFVNYIGRDGDIYVTEFRSVHGVGALSSRREVLHVPTTNKPFGHYGGPLGLTAASTPASATRTSRSRHRTRRRCSASSSGSTSTGAEPEIRALGLRNPWRLSFDRATGDVYVGDVGQDRREEFDRLPRAFHGLANFGWPVWEGSVRIRPVPADLPGRVLPPFVEYRHAKGRCNAVTGGYVYRGSQLKRLDGRYVYGDLCGGVWSVTVRGGVARDKRAEPLSPPGLLVSFAEGWQGELYIVALNGGIL
jgi:glucose/arabinose dehydrogenase